MSLIGDIAGAYRAPSNSMQVQIERGITEPQTLFYGMLFGVINLIASFPRVMLSAPDQDTFTGMMAGLFISYVFFLPLMLYGLAGLLHWVLLKFDGQASYAEMRRALNWAAVVTAPFVLLSGASYALNNSTLTSILNLITATIFLWQLRETAKQVEYT
ncbi:YIP1 family protein [Amylibacter sp. SFDW26]|uniref:YIP1 family protein n=1 Tax=Amylibacter sp. SFDW26 TaxID=2652722 RepID=UPI00186A0226|nr:YIP1 family protein [Amylibacter sp. SFDW26]